MPGAKIQSWQDAAPTDMIEGIFKFEDTLKLAARQFPYKK